MYGDDHVKSTGLALKRLGVGMPDNKFSSAPPHQYEFAERDVMANFPSEIGKYCQGPVSEPTLNCALFTHITILKKLKNSTSMSKQTCRE